MGAVGLGRQRHRERERELATDAVHARHQHSGPPARLHHARQQHEPPDRHREVAVAPRLAQVRPADGDDRLQPLVPGADELVGQPPAREVAEPWQLSIPARDLFGRLHHHSWVGQWNCFSSGRRNGFFTLDATISNTARRPSRLIDATNRSSWLVSSILTSSNMRKSAHGPSNVIPLEPDFDGGVSDIRTWFRPLDPGNCTFTATCGPWA